MSNVSVYDISEGVEQPDLDLLVRHWLQISATAWHGYLAQKRGVVVIDQRHDGLRISYCPDAPCPCCEGLIATYDPELTVVVAIRGEVFPVTGTPTPIEAYQHATAALLEVAIH